MEALLGLLSLAGLIFSSGYLVYCFMRKKNYVKFSVWLIVLFFGLLLAALNFLIPGAFLLGISIYKIITDQEIKQQLQKNQSQSIDQEFEDENENDNPEYHSPNLENQQSDDIELDTEAMKQRYSQWNQTIEEQHNQELLKKDDSTDLEPQKHTLQPQSNKAGLFHQGVFCPYCRSLNVDFMKNNRKNFSVGKAVGGTLLTGGVGSLAGFAGKKGKKNTWHCKECGRTFTSKK